MLTVFPILLAYSWELSKRSEDECAPCPKKNTKVATNQTRQKVLLAQRHKKGSQHTKMANKSPPAPISAPSRNYHDHYVNAMNACVGLRILASRSVTRREAERGQQLLSYSFQSWASMNAHLTPNFHYAMHMLEYIYALGSVYNFWVFPFERFMGVLSRFKTNGHKGGELESTLMRGWWKSMSCHNIVSYIWSY